MEIVIGHITEFVTYTIKINGVKPTSPICSISKTRDWLYYTHTHIHTHTHTNELIFMIHPFLRKPRLQECFFVNVCVDHVCFTLPMFVGSVCACMGMNVCFLMCVGVLVYVLVCVFYSAYV